MFRMIKPLSTSVMIILFIMIFVVNVQAESDVRINEDGLIESSAISHMCNVPYNINIAGFNTGLNIVPNWSNDVSFKIRFMNGGDSPYASTYIDIPSKGWTGTIDQLLHWEGQNSTVSLRFPTKIYVYSYEKPSQPGHEITFWVVQFLFTNSGFSHQAFPSYYYPY